MCLLYLTPSSGNSIIFDRAQGVILSHCNHNNIIFGVPLDQILSHHRLRMQP